MNNYDFSTLNDIEFELLTLDLLNCALELNLRSFKEGRDEGRDLRYASPENKNEIVVQVKHYQGSKYSQLKHALEKSELPKVQKFNPKRYIVVTSLSLNANQVDEIKAFMAPYILSSQDVIDGVCLNNWLRSYPQVEENHFKLWFSSTTILKAILNNAVAGRTMAYVEKIRNKSSCYVMTRRLNEAMKILNKEKLLLISGQPGIGKSTLADILFLAKAKMGYKIFKVYDIEEAEKAISTNEDEKQLFYYDDFLGEIYYEVLPASHHESSLTAFVERVRNTPNKYLILTTRTVILAQATEKSEKINYSDIASLQFELKLGDNTIFEKAQILYNHLHANDLGKTVISAVLDKKFYMKIIRHKNYTPRIIESITKPVVVRTFTIEQYQEFVLANLINPEKIWSSSFYNQIKYFDQRLLLTLFTCPKGMTESHLQLAFEERLSYEKRKNNQIVKSNQFVHSVKMLLSGFISSSLISKPRFLEKDEIQREYKLINPSLSDFLAGYLKYSFIEKKGIIASLLYLEQLVHFNPENGLLPLEQELQFLIKDRIVAGTLESMDEYTSYRFDGFIVDTLCRYCIDIPIDDLLLEKFKKIDFSKSIWWIRDQISFVLLNIGTNKKTRNFISENFLSIIDSLITVEDNEKFAAQIPHLFKLYDCDYESYQMSDLGRTNLISLIKKISEYQARISVLIWQDNVTNIQVVNDIYRSLDEKDAVLKKLLLEENFDLSLNQKIDVDFWNEKIKSNLIRERKPQVIEDFTPLFKQPIVEPHNEMHAIDQLFKKLEGDE